MKEIPVSRLVKRLFGAAFLLFMLNKFYFRPWVLQHNLGGLLEIMVFSLPNFVEAVLGTLVLTGILLQIRQYLSVNTPNTIIYLMATSMAASYVISQELKFHNLGGNNVYDPYDLWASIIGLTFAFSVIQIFGFVEIRKE